MKLLLHESIVLYCPKWAHVQNCRYYLTSCHSTLINSAMYTAVESIFVFVHRCLERLLKNKSNNVINVPGAGRLMFHRCSTVPVPQCSASCANNVYLY